MSSDKSFTAKEILIWRKNQLLKGGRAVDIDWLLDVGGGIGWKALQKLKIFQNTSHTLALSLDQLSEIWEKHINDHAPLQHLLGKCPWRDFELEISSSALIPRQETELLIEIVLSKFDSIRKENGIWADLGTGSGALAICLARYFPSWIGHAIDSSEAALCLAEKNINNLVNNSQVILHLGDWWDPLKPWLGEIDLVVANPPYIPKANLKKLDPVVRNHEPHLALCGGDDGMNHCRTIIKGAKYGLRTGGWLFLEHDFDQSERVLKFLEDSGFTAIDFARDLEGVKRFAFGRKP